ncbi:hypothetical protein TIFTF001_013653 [Ficus carica]|uniref:Uncharacterized protein n=1 Tax=Ficus carica TaxID=3494 RepID=A0AA88A2F2_FICCA|nr:hypothetical protein TIFTF001_013653 [Ficus carica]
MADKLHLAVGVMGNAASLLLYAAPILTFSRVIMKRSLEEFSCVPYTIALLNCLLYAWYGFPILKVAVMAVLVITIFSITALISASVFHDHHHRKSPNLVGCPLCILQLVLYCKYRNNVVTEEPAKWDVEKNNHHDNDNDNDDKIKPNICSPVIDHAHNNINGKC